MSTERGAEAEVQFVREPTRLRLRGETSLLLPSPKRKIVELEEGTVSAKVAPQPPGQPLVFKTLQSEATVLEQSCCSPAMRSPRTLAVTEGRVRLRRLSDGAAIEVGANQLAVAAEDIPLAPRPLPVSSTAAKALRSLNGHTGDITAVAFSADGKCIVSGSEDHTLKIWDTHAA
ncbi:MAG: WD40 domain-containing protein, partial [Verrucomicrobiota bacterium]|nr:WD40 domain-containing protein [Verrucomicrobiota bacterium]